MLRKSYTWLIKPSEDKRKMKEFQRLVGEQLSAVCFVQDYVQLQFDGYQLTTYTTPLVKTEKGAYLTYADKAYKNRGLG